MTSGLAHEPTHKTMQQVVRFVLDRLDEDERNIRLRARRHENIGIGSWSQERIRTELDARREMVGILQRMAVLRDLPAERPVREHAERIVQYLALPYSDHQRFDPSWSD